MVVVIMVVILVVVTPVGSEFAAPQPTWNSYSEVKSDPGH